MIRDRIKKLTITDIIIMLLIIIIPICFILNLSIGLIDNDLWYLLSEGRAIIQGGIYHTDILSMHQGLDIVVQNWLSAVILWIIYAFGGFKAIYFMVLIINIIIGYLIYKICMLIGNNKYLSLIISLITDLNLCLYFVLSKPQIFSFVVILLVIYLLELYIKNDDTKYLKFIPLLSFLEINLHAALWWFIVLFLIPYIIDSFKFKKIGFQGYNTKPLIITLILSVLASFINPYGYKAITFIFNSYGDTYMFNNIYELQPFTFGNLISINIFALALITSLLYAYFRRGEIRIRYICLYVGTLLLGMRTIKLFSYFILVSMFPLALLFNNIIPKEFKNKKIINYIGSFLFIILIGITIINYSKKDNRINFSHASSDAIDVIDTFAKNKPATVYSSNVTGSYVEFRGYKPYIDSRAEVFLKKNNHVKNIYHEYYDFENGKININDFLEMYNFDFLLVGFGDRLYFQDKIDNYFIIYDMAKTGYKLYMRNDVVTDEVRKYIIEEYEKSKNNK